MPNRKIEASELSALIDECVDSCSDSVKFQMQSRGYRAAVKLRNASQLVLRGQRSGRMYNVPGTGRVRYYKRDSKDGKHKKGTATITYRKYQASAPGEPPAVRTGAFRLGWHEKAYSIEQNGKFSMYAQIENRTMTDNGKYLLGDLLEGGSGRMAARPYKERIQEKAKKEIEKIFNEPYF